MSSIIELDDFKDDIIVLYREDLFQISKRDVTTPFTNSVIKNDVFSIIGYTKNHVIQIEGWQNAANVLYNYFRLLCHFMYIIFIYCNIYNKCYYIIKAIVSRKWFNDCVYYYNH